MGDGEYISAISIRNGAVRLVASADGLQDPVATHVALESTGVHPR
jgi:hypothetical protein